MQLVLRYSGREGRRFILSLPYWVGMLQGWFLEKLPENLFTVTRDQVCPIYRRFPNFRLHRRLFGMFMVYWHHVIIIANQAINHQKKDKLLTHHQVQQLKHDNIVAPVPPLNSVSFERVLSAFPPSLPSSAPVTPDDAGLTSVYKILPQYLGPQITRQEGKRTHGRPGVGFEEIERLRQKTK